MGIRHKIAQYRLFRQGVCHCTFNPEGPGVVRIHLVPPKFRLFRSTGYIVILNGYYLLPLGYSWAVILANLIREVEPFHGKPISEKDRQKILEGTVKRVCKVYPGTPGDLIRDDLIEMMDMLFHVARGGDPGIPKISIRDYGPNMTAPHRMDLMVSAMTDEKGNWQCNQKCTFCYAAGQPMSGCKELDTRQWKQVIDRLEAARVPMITFTGGEPTMREDLPQLVAYGKRMVTRLNTNGINLTPKLVRSLKEAGLDSVQVTLYSHDPDVHNALVGGDHHGQTLEGIKNAVNAGLDVSVNTPLCHRNSDYLSTLRLLHKLGVRFVTVSGLICTGMAGRNHADHDLTADALYDIVKDAKKFCDKHDMEMDFTSPGLIDKGRLEKLGLNVPMCGACLSNMAIAPDGTVVPCQSWLGSDAALGNILEVPFKKIWKHPKAVKLRKMGERAALNCPFRSEKGGDGQ